MDKKSTRGGKREGSGRPAAADPKVKIWVSIKASKLEYAKEKIRALADKINRQP